MDWQSRAHILALGSATALAIGLVTPAWAHGVTERVSIGPSGAQAEFASYGPSISANGRFVAFWSASSNLVRGDTNGENDVFVRDRLKGMTRRVSLGADGVQGNQESTQPSISANGRFVAFVSFASNLVPGDTNGIHDIFVRDRVNGTTERVSVGPHGVQADSDSHEPSISADGRFVAFVSFASNLVPGDTNGRFDVFVRDRVNGTTERVSVGPRGVQADSESEEPSVSANGRFVAFWSGASNLVPSDSNGHGDIFVRDRLRNTTERVSVGRLGVQGDGGTGSPAISADGRFVVFFSDATNLVPSDTNGIYDVFVRDRLKGTTERVSVGPRGVQADGYSIEPSISPDGRFVVFASVAGNLVRGVDTYWGKYRVFVHDRQLGTNRRVSVGPGGVDGDGDSGFNTGTPAVSAGGRFIAFGSFATNLVPGDTNGEVDVFVRSLVP